MTGRDVGIFATVFGVVFVVGAVFANRSSNTTAPRWPSVPVTQAAIGPTLPYRPRQKQAAQQRESVSVAPSNDVTKGQSRDDVLRLRSRRLTIPLPDVDATQLVDTYTQSRAAGAAHQAIDIMAPRGTPVLAVEDGRVAKLFLSKSGGITLYQFDPDGEYVYYYAHLDRYANHIKEGDVVRRGQVVGYVGVSGNALPDAPHLHFAIGRLGPERQWWRSSPINPFYIWRDPKP